MFTVTGDPPKGNPFRGAIVRLSCSGDGDAKQEAITKYRNTTTTTNHRDTIQEHIMNHQNTFLFERENFFRHSRFLPNRSLRGYFPLTLWEIPHKDFAEIAFSKLVLRPPPK